MEAVGTTIAVIVIAYIWIAFFVGVATENLGNGVFWPIYAWRKMDK